MGVVNKVLAVSVLLIAIWFGFFARQYAAGGSVDPEWLNRSLAGRTAIVTGGNAGIGFITAKQLAKQGAAVIIASRDEKRAKEAVASINNETNSNLAEFVHPLDLSSFRSVRDFVEKVKDRKIDYLINNAGVMIPPHAQTEDGFEIQFQTNHLSHFLLTELLLDTIKKSNGRVINVSSLAHLLCFPSADFEDVKGPQEKHFDFYLYGKSKLANIIYSKQLAERGVLSYSLHPGSVLTDLTRSSAALTYVYKNMEKLMLMFLKTPWEGAQTTMYAVLCDENDVPSGSYLSDCQAVSPNSLAQDETLHKQLWNSSVKYTGLLQ